MKRDYELEIKSSEASVQRAVDANLKKLAEENDGIRGETDAMGEHAAGTLQMLKEEEGKVRTYTQKDMMLIKTGQMHQGDEIRQEDNTAHEVQTATEKSAMEINADMARSAEAAKEALGNLDTGAKTKALLAKL